ncbi:MAG: DEAD/DEAH box helicase [Clostridia bacterium]|nr:DEAD/DEAH box helicase [Clostridia bacterium]
MIELTEDQKKADELIVKWFQKSKRQVFVLAGYAGTGKTTLVRHTVTETLKLVPDKSVAFVTPTGKAATVLIRSGTPASTLHKLIYQSIVRTEEVQVAGKTLKVDKLIFVRRESIDEDIKLIVLDEASMVSDEVLQDICRFGVKVIVCGDPAQLPPVEGYGSCLQLPDITLTTIVRQEQDNPIIMLSKRARDGEPIAYGKYGNTVQVIPRQEFYGNRRRKFLLGADQIICGINRTRSQVNDEVRKLLGYESSLPQDGEKLICTLNNWELFIDPDMRFNLVNGIIGTCYKPFYVKEPDMGFLYFKPDFLDDIVPEEIPFDTGIFTAGRPNFQRGDYFQKFNEKGEPVDAFTLNRFEYGYCISCHKAQGSEFGNLVIFDESWAFKEDRTKWLYTAITRAKNKLVIVR